MNLNYYGNTQNAVLLIKIVRFIVIPMVIIAGEVRMKNQYPKYIWTKVYLFNTSHKFGSLKYTPWFDLYKSTYLRYLLNLCVAFLSVFLLTYLMDSHQVYWFNKSHFRYIIPCSFIRKSKDCYFFPATFNFSLT